ncbi:hypothetical protein EMCRGX_G005785 [Ephydatia muelleri]
MELSNYVEFRALLTKKARSLDDSVLCSLDLLLPHTAGIDFNLENARIIEVRKMLEEMMAKDVSNHLMVPGLLQLQGLYETMCGWDLSNSTEAVPTQVGLVLPLPFQLLSPKVMSDQQLAGPSVSPVMTAVANTQKPLPDELHSDRGKQFESNLISEMCALSQIKKSRTTSYHSQGNGLVERQQEDSTGHRVQERTQIAQHGEAEQQRSTTSNPCKPNVLGEQLSIESDDEPPPPRDQQPLIEAPPPVAIEPAHSN